MIGTKLSHFEITGHLGSGGMGDVYQATDSKLGRNVALKLLPEAFVGDADRVARFDREARVLAALNHPNIAAVYGLEQTNGRKFLVMELVPGETLAERVRRGPIPLNEALDIAKQICEALEAAHERGIVHRDLKPANIKVTPERKVKVLDFGLAKACEADSSNMDLSDSPTRMTTSMPGVVLGTAAYMSPEQASGKNVTKAADIWAFAAVLYELLTGTQAFQGDDTSHILASVLKTEPDWNRLPANIPPAIRTLIRRCLRKDARHRISDAGAVRIEIEDALESPVTLGPVGPGSSPGGRRVAVLAFAGTALFALVAFATWHLKPSPAIPPLAVTRTVITIPSGQQLAGLEDGPALAASPDGKYLAYVARENGVQQIFLRPMDALETKHIAGTEGAFSPFFSPDGQWLAFFAGGKLKKVALNGGAPIDLADAVQPRGATWGSEGIITFVPTTVSVLHQVSDAGGSTKAVGHLEKGEFSHAWPDFLPGGKTILFNTVTRVGGQIAIQSETDDHKTLFQGGYEPRYVPSGHLVYVQSGSLMAVPFDLHRLAAAGSAVPVVDGIFQGSVAHYSFSATGLLVYLLGDSKSNQRNLVWVDRRGEEEPLTVPSNPYSSPRLSPDGRRIVVPAGAMPGSPIFLYDFSRDALTRIISGGTLNQFPIWTPDGTRIVFDSNRQGSANIFAQPADGGGGLERLGTSEFSQWPTSWSSDGQLLVYVQDSPDTGWDIWVLRKSDGKALPFLRTPANEGGPQFSPDGRWIAYASDESGPWEVYVQPYPGPGGKWQISTGGGTEPMWNPKGKELFYRNGNKMIAVDVTADAGLSVGKPHTLFERNYQPGLSPIANYDVSADGQRFLMIKPHEDAAVLTQIVVVQNWFSELRQRVPLR